MCEMWCWPYLQSVCTQSLQIEFFLIAPLVNLTPMSCVLIKVWTELNWITPTGASQHKIMLHLERGLHTIKINNKKRFLTGCSSVSSRFPHHLLLKVHLVVSYDLYSHARASQYNRRPLLLELMCPTRGHLDSICWVCVAVSLPGNDFCAFCLSTNSK